MLAQSDAFRLPFRDGVFQTVVTSPPYYSLRKYSGEQRRVFGGDVGYEHEWEAGSRKGISGGENEWSKSRHFYGDRASEVPTTEFANCLKCGAWLGAYGLEPTLDMYVQHTVEWCREIWRVLRPDGTFWLNIGDSYAGSGGPGSQYDNKAATKGKPFEKFHNPNREASSHGLKPKDLMGVPWTVALALRADGWYLRRDIIWHKPNPMPESTPDRPTTSHEYVFLLTKSARYFYDQEAVRERGITNESRPHGIVRDREYGYDSKQAVLRSQRDSFKRIGNKNGMPESPQKRPDRREDTWDTTSRNRRSVWTINTAPFSGAHFATWPPALVEPMIKAGSSERGRCPECGAPWERVVEKSVPPYEVFTQTKQPSDGFVSGGSWRGGGKGSGQKLTKWLNENPPQTLGFRPTCDHDHEPTPCLIFDPFAGSGTSIMVANALGRRGVGIDLSWEYLQLARERMGAKAMDEWLNGKDGQGDLSGLPLFEELFDA